MSQPYPLSKSLVLFFILAVVAGASPRVFSQPAGNAEIPEAVLPEVNGVVADNPPSPEPVPPAGKSPAEYLRQAWKLSGQTKWDDLVSLVDECLGLYDQKAREQQASLAGFPSRGREADYQVLNDVGTILFVKAEFVMNQGRKDEAIALFEDIIRNYQYAQAWDPSRGAFWSVAEKSQASIDVMLGKVKDEPDTIEKRIRTLPSLHAKGTASIIDYTKYGEFIGVGTENYSYKVNDPAALSKAVGEGIYPNTGAILKNPGYKKAKAEGRLEGSHWDYVHSDDLEAAYYKWAMASEPWGIKLFYLGMIFEKAKMYSEALKSYHAIVVHFPKTVGWTYWQTPWYPGQAAIAKIKHLVRSHPELNLKVKWMKMEVKNGFDNDITNDRIITYPGVVQKNTFWDSFREKLNLDSPYVPLRKIVKTVGSGKVKLVQYDNGHWQMMVDGKPFLLKGVTYHPTKIGQSPDKGTLKPWMKEDSNNNGKPDGPYDVWVDKNRNNKQDADEPVVGDFQLLKDMGANAIREYHQPVEPDKEVMRRMHEQYGLYLILGDFLGKYALGSGADWDEGTDYENPVHQKNMMESVRKMVLAYKDEPYILMWVLGNENNYGVASNADKKPEAYFKFANEVAKMIKALDPNHPVAFCNGDTLYLDIFAKHAPDVDIFGANVYRGDYGFGSFWEQVFDATGKPAFITEYGAPAYARHLTLDEGEAAQANYHMGNWMDIEANTAGRREGTGNALGGVLFEWVDEWWKNYEPFYHDKKSDAIGPFPGGYYFEEWFGITGQGDGQSSPFLRHLRKAYFTYKQMWSKPYPPKSPGKAASRVFLLIAAVLIGFGIAALRKSRTR
ncbi:MAG: glycoside hydrolase family 2 TIM barrel-domain containing protein [Candidatus Omnitrophota bacterium]|nr:glycoside hydrolase family 2 TIM barrel-domain containing protein [Candidatus Omnitrophota bacterium]MDZ4243267.1 glycoside hydrolase family 2 TIM barrel-domain containing protein [Candidatus Omnitrophota bacterium]